MSSLPLIVDIDRRLSYVRFVQEQTHAPQQTTSLFDRLVGRSNSLFFGAVDSGAAVGNSHVSANLNGFHSGYSFRLALISN
jgi:hypothetical protein